MYSQDGGKRRGRVKSRAGRMGKSRRRGRSVRKSRASNSRRRGRSAARRTRRRSTRRRSTRRRRRSEDSYTHRYHYGPYGYPAYRPYLGYGHHYVHHPVVTTPVVHRALSPVMVHRTATLSPASPQVGKNVV